MFFESWTSLGRTAAAGAIAYVALVIFLRVSGKRTLAKMNAFDLVVTVALGSTLSSILISRQTPLADGLLALVLLIALQFVVAWTSVRWGWFARAVKSEPTVLVRDGRIRPHALRRQRIVEAEVLAAARAGGAPQLQDVRLLVLETDGTFSVVRTDPARDAAAAPPPYPDLDDR